MADRRGPLPTGQWYTIINFGIDNPRVGPYGGSMTRVGLRVAFLPCMRCPFVQCTTICPHSVRKHFINSGEPSLPPSLSTRNRRQMMIPRDHTKGKGKRIVVVMVVAVVVVVTCTRWNVLPNPSSPYLLHS